MRYVVAAGEPWTVRTILKAGRPFDRWEHCTTREALRQALTDPPAPRYVFFLRWSDRVPTEILESVECVNFHCTPLPYGRGGHPIENLILRGHTETVITAHRMTAEFDAGPVYGTRGPVSLAGTKDEILARFVAPCADLMRWIVSTEPTPAPQVGEVVRFQRLTPAAYARVWAERATCLRS
jgi:methionyl-tRNA formyltransferase